MPTESEFRQRLKKLQASHDALIKQPNHPAGHHNGIYRRWDHPVLTARHTPLFWRYDLDYTANPFLMERMGINATFNAGAIYREGKYIVAVRVEGTDRKSFFAIAESPS